MTDGNQTTKALKRDVQGRYLYGDFKIVAVRGGFIIEGDESGKIYPSVDLARKSIDYRTNW